MIHLILLVLIPFTAKAYTLNNNLAATFDNEEVKVYYADNCNEVSLTQSDWDYVITEAGNRFWNTVPTSKLKLINGGMKTVDSKFHDDSLCTNTGDTCEINSDLVVSDNILVSCNDNTTNFSSGSILAKAIPNNTSGKTIIGAIVLVNDTSSSAFKDLSMDEKISVVSHEIGHALGLGHSQFKDNLMHAESSSSREKLGWDDIDGISYLYPKEQPFAGFCSTIDVSKNTPPKSGSGKFPLLFLLLIMALGTISSKAFKKTY